MSARSGIEWTEATWNPVVGCTPTSEGCDHCYAAREASGRLSKHAVYQGLAVDGQFTGEVRTLPERLDQPLKWTKPRRIFVNSMSDLFHDAVPIHFVADVFAVMALAQQHTFQVLTKRPGRMRTLLDRGDFQRMVWMSAWRRNPNYDEIAGLVNAEGLPVWPLPNVWLGVSVENQKWADVRIPKLLETPAAVRWLSCEPLLGPVQLTAVRVGNDEEGNVYRDVLRRIRVNGRILPGLDQIDWVVAGGESGSGARPMHPEWARSLREQCRLAGVPFLFKQWGEWSPDRPQNWRDYRSDRRDTFLPDGTRYRPTEPDMLNLPAMASMFRIGKKAAGRVLDGHYWDGYPEVPA